MPEDLRKPNTRLPCRIKNLDGTPCRRRATHFWGTITFCCSHFDEFVVGMFELSEEMRARRHTELVKYYQRRTRRESHLGPEPQPAKSDER